MKVYLAPIHQIFILIFVTRLIKCDETTLEKEETTTTEIVTDDQDPFYDYVTNNEEHESRIFYNNGFWLTGVTGVMYGGVIFAIFHIIYALHLEYVDQVTKLEKAQKEREMKKAMKAMNATKSMERNHEQVVEEGPQYDPSSYQNRPPYIPYYYQELYNRVLRSVSTAEESNLGVKSIPNEEEITIKR